MANGNESASLDRAIKCLKYVIGTISIYYILQYIMVSLIRMTYPYEMEWMEGGTLIYARRILDGAGIYVRPTPEFAPFFYTPFYYYLAAIASPLSENGFFAPRLISFLFSLGNFAWLAAFVRAKGGGNYGGLIAAGLFAAAYRMTGSWYDLARVDSMFLFFLLGATYLMITRTGNRSAILGGAFIAISYFTKQTALAVAVWIFVCELKNNYRRAVIFIGSAAIPILVFTIVFDASTDGWFSYVTRQLMLHQHYHHPSIYTFWTSDMLLQLPVCIGIALVAFAMAIRSGKKADAWMIALLGIGFVGASWMSRINVGGYRNVLIPAVTYAAVICGCSVPTIAQSVRTKHVCFLYVFLLAQFALFQFDMPTKSWNNPLRWIPSDADKKAADQRVEELRQVEGDVLISNHPYLLLLAGKKLCAHTAGVDDVMRGDDGRVRDDLIGEIRRRIHAGEYAAIVLEREWIFRRDVEKHYQFSRKIFADDVFWPVTGWRTRPEEIWIPRSASPEIH